MIARPTIFRARVALGLLARHPDGWTPNQVGFLLGLRDRAEEIREALEAMRSDGLLVEALGPPRGNHARVRMFVASPALVACAMRGGGA